MSRVPRVKPVDLAPGPWPEKPSSDPAGEIARKLVLNLQRALTTQKSIRAVATLAGIDHTTILKILAGRSWPDLHTIVRLEQSLGVPLWPAPATS
jgi:transcriptional regulator with XRE-family HTH domain